MHIEDQVRELIYDRHDSKLSDLKTQFIEYII